MLLDPTIDRILNAYFDNNDFVIECGGTRSGKTFGMLGALILLARTDKKSTLTSVVSMTMPHLRKGAVNDFKNIMLSDGTYNDANWNEQKLTYTFTETGSRIEFFSADSPMKVHGPARNRLFLNECQSLPWDTVSHLIIRTDGIVFADYNPTRKFWIDTEIMAHPDYEGRFSFHRSTYLDNIYLSEKQIRHIEARKSDPVWWSIYGEGKTGEIRTGCIYQGWSQITNKEFDAIDAPTVYGLDFGFSPDPTAVVAIKFVKRQMYIRELIYEQNLTLPAVSVRMRELGVSKDNYVIADWGNGGKMNIYTMRQGVEVNGDKLAFNVYPAIKPRGSIIAGIEIIHGYEVFATAGSVNLWNEYNLYRRKKGLEDVWLPEPVDADNHIMDAIRYVASMRERKLF